MNSKYNRVIFIHIHKTAGTSIVNHLKEFFNPQKTLLHGGFFEIPPEELGNYKLLTGHFSFGRIQQLLADSYSFTFLRDPVERVLSFYSFWKERPAKQFPISEIIQKNDLAAFVNYMDPEVCQAIDNHQTWQLAYTYLNFAREKYKHVSVDEILGKAKENLDALNFVGFKETFADDFQHIMFDLDLPAPEKNIHVYKTKKPIIKESLPKAVLQKIESRVELDTALYN
jgi:hypothetical protein